MRSVRSIGRVAQEFLVGVHLAHGIRSGVPARQSYLRPVGGVAATAGIGEPVHRERRQDV